MKAYEIQKKHAEYLKLQQKQKDKAIAKRKPQPNKTPMALRMQIPLEDGLDSGSNAETSLPPAREKKVA